MCVVRMYACTHRVCCICAHVCKQLYKDACVLCVCVYWACMCCMLCVHVRACVCFPDLFSVPSTARLLGPLLTVYLETRCPVGSFTPGRKAKTKSSMAMGQGTSNFAGESLNLYFPVKIHWTSDAKAS